MYVSNKKATSVLQSVPPKFGLSKVEKFRKNTISSNFWEVCSCTYTFVYLLKVNFIHVSFKLNTGSDSLPQPYSILVGSARSHYDNTVERFAWDEHDYQNHGVVCVSTWNADTVEINLE
jgi:hypothetical protein